MALGIVSDEEFEKEIARCADNNARHKDIVRGRGARPEVPEIIREVIAEEVIAGSDTQKEIADKFGVSTASVSAYAHDATSTATYNEPDKKLQRANNKLRNEIIGTARQKLFDALSQITPDKLKDAKVRDVASVAKDMSTIIHNVEPNTPQTNIGAQFVFHVPKQKSESEFEVIDVTT